MRLPLLLRLALKDLAYDWRPSGALMLAIVAVSAPLLLLFGLKTGVVTTMRDILVKDPRNLEVIVFENARLPLDWFDQLRTRTDSIRFLIPRTRTLNTLVDLQGASGDILRSVEILPTAADDPLLPKDTVPPAEPTEVFITGAIAARLGVSPGEPLSAILKRTLSTGERQESVQLQVTGIVPDTNYARPAIFASLDFLIALEDYRGGYRVPAFGVTEGAERTMPRTSFSGARLYAKQPEDVASLANLLRHAGLEVRTRGEDLARLNAAERFLTRILLSIAVVSLVGGYLSFGGAIWITIERKRYPLALLQLLGFSRPGVLAFCLVQGGFLGLCAFGLSFLLFELGSVLLNAFGAGPFLDLLGADGAVGPVCTLGGGELLAAAIATVAFSVLASTLGAVHATSFEPAQCLREA